MRKYKAYVIYDIVAEVYSEWMFKASNENDARRAFEHGLEKGDMRPQDVVLYEIAEYDRVLGVVSGYEIPHLVVSGIDCTRKEEIDE